ncbi:hypothetical protein FXN65_06170 [Metapseudomonas lalkuanensis]|uniref:Uncharacterized protein n=1 Tax=Metapseudomonas lalkuanensis TaxID=2604832 RepID=A0A5J6QG04_9GAMM|nr:hypothetical protein [Pseudomonas lalkuanensis]QEY61658.1 hypothetical protein FXN65_06170 [Pseudomonas lalkuanensis]UCO99425.1 hypothetical protein LF844_06335 [Pseudomonas lalkuanensis]
MKFGKKALKETVIAVILRGSCAFSSASMKVGRNGQSGEEVLDFKSSCPVRTPDLLAAHVPAAVLAGEPRRHRRDAPVTLTAELNYWPFPQRLVDYLLGKDKLKVEVTRMGQAARAL